jgi:tetratricopeptide (TPR) repeat protein
MAESAHRPLLAFGLNGVPPRLQSWKEIAAYFGRSVKTVQRWEARRGLPVYRVPGRLGSVYAYDFEIAAWLNRHETPLGPGEPGGALQRWTPWLATAGGLLLVAALSVTLAIVLRSSRSSAPRRLVDPEAREAYLKGRLFLESPTEEGARKAIDSLERAVRQDPAHAPAYASLARAHLAAANLFVPTRKAKDAAWTAASKALSLDPSLAEGFTSRGLLRAALDWDLKGSEGDLRSAVAIDAGDAKAHLYLGITLMLQGRREEGLAEIEQARQLDPLSLKINSRLGMVYAVLGWHERALEQCRQALELDKNAAEAHACLGYALERKGVFRDAASEYERAGDLGYPASPHLARLAALGGQEAEARKRLRSLQEGWRKGRAGSPYEIARVCHALGDDEEAFAWLETAYEEHDKALIALAVEPDWESLHSDPRFVALTRTIGVRAPSSGPSLAPNRLTSR